MSSVIFVDWNMKDNEHEREAFQIMAQISDKNMKINTDFGKYGNELTFLDSDTITKCRIFSNIKKISAWNSDKVHSTARRIRKTVYRNARCQ